MTYIYGYKPGLRSVRALREHGINSIKHQGSRFRGSARKTVINWGSRQIPLEVMNSRVVNRPDAVAAAGDKISCLGYMQSEGVAHVEYSTERDEAASWIADGGVAVCRTLANASGGRGIVVSETVDQIVSAPLYTKYKKSKSEWRVHVFGGAVIDTQRKVRNPDTPDDEVDWKVRNHDRGFIFQRNNPDVPADLHATAIAAVAAIPDLYFGAVDLIYNGHEDKSYVLEINCAPNLEGSTVESYARAINAL